MSLFPSVEWFRRLAERMNTQLDRYTRLGVADLTLILKINFPRGDERYALTFDGYGCRAVRRMRENEAPGGRHPVILEGDFQVWKDMIENIGLHGAADPAHTLNTLTFRHKSLRLTPGSDGGQLDVDRF